jgi:hypothetical protein
VVASDRDRLRVGQRLLETRGEFVGAHGGGPLLESEAQNMRPYGPGFKQPPPISLPAPGETHPSAGRAAVIMRAGN